MTIRPDFSPHFIANDLALDFVNSAYGVGNDSCDCLADDASALAWLAAAGQLLPELNVPSEGLANLARSLRQAARQLINGTKSERAHSIALVNEILELGRRQRTLFEDSASNFTVIERRRDDSPASLLEPVAMALARLLADGKLSQVRQCEAHDCTLHFLDVTKSGRRRWCSMAICGNRMKVTAFRARKEAR